MPTQERALATRAAVIHGAATVFNARGYANASLDLIADEAGVTRGAMYFHFHSKDEIANAVIDEQHRVARVAAGKALAEAESAVEGMLRMCASLAHQLTSETIVSAGIRLTTDGTASELSAENPYLEWIDSFETLVTLGQEQGDLFEHLDPRRVAEYIIPSYTGVQLVSDTLRQRRDLLDRIRDMWELLFPALVRPERMESARHLLSIVSSR